VQENMHEEDTEEPAVCIVLTDLAGSFPDEEPTYPVIWASIDPGEAPFGKTLYLGDV
jgi:hypothetical protein